MARFIPEQLKPPVTRRPIQLNHIGTVQPPITAGQPKKIRNKWSRDHAGYYREGFLAHGSMSSKVFYTIWHAGDAKLIEAIQKIMPC